MPALSESYRRHTLTVRIWHWVNLLALTLLLMSGLQIFNAHPGLYWGKSSYTGAGPFLEMRARENSAGEPIGVTRIGHTEFDTTGILGLSTSAAGQLTDRGFPAWSTIPSYRSLAQGRRWHFFFAWLFFFNGLAYVTWSFASRHVSRDLAPTRADWRSIGRSFLDHLLFRHPRGDAAKRYNILQKITYLVVLFVLLPLMVLTGMAMSPWLNSVLPGWVDWLGGRQSARTLHFLAAWALVLFVLIHVFEVLVSGVWNNLRSMITGRYSVPPEAEHGRT